MDTLYTGDIPSDYIYAVFNNGYITLYNQPYATNNSTLHYYRIYNNNGFYYTEGNQNFGFGQTDFQEIKTSNNWLYRNDIDKIFTVCFFFILLFIFIFNIVTSVFKKGRCFWWLTIVFIEFLKIL